uniref:EF-hand domain-containing protein n=1 Tax=Macrostomum lignano TaxID=282301 RepID=A0A1I8FHZ9_9PLAT
TTFDEAQPQSPSCAEQQEQLTRRRSSAASAASPFSCSAAADQDLAEKLAAVCNSLMPAAKMPQPSGSRSRQRSRSPVRECHRRHVERASGTSAAPAGSLRPPACALSWQPNLPPGWRSPSLTDSDVSETPSALSPRRLSSRNEIRLLRLLRHRRQHRRLRPILQLASPNRQPAAAPAAEPPADLPEKPPQLAATRRKFNPSLEFPEFSHRDINRLREAFVDEDHDSRINFREFLAIFRKARAGQLDYSASSWPGTTATLSVGDQR